jgi:hypothetical protein
MLDLQSAFADFASDIEANEPSIDRDFITAFLLPYFSNLPREQLAAMLEEIIALEQDKPASRESRRRVVANTADK